MKQIIVVEPGSVSETDKVLLRKEGVLFIEHKNPQSVRVINNIDGFEGDDIFQMALASLYTDSNHSMFGKFMIQHLKSKKKASSTV